MRVRQNKQCKKNKASLKQWRKVDIKKNNRKEVKAKI